MIAVGIIITITIWVPAVCYPFVPDKSYAKQIIEIYASSVLYLLSENFYVISCMLVLCTFLGHGTKPSPYFFSIESIMGVYCILCGER